MKNKVLTRIASVLIALSFIFFMDSCRKETIPCDEMVTLPSATQNGAQELGFLKNGAVWRVSGIRQAGIHVSANEVELVHYDGVLWLRGMMDRDCEEGNRIHDTFTITMNDVFSTGVYSVDSIGENECEFRGLDSRLFEASNGQVEITRLDTVAKIISGTFEIEVYDIQDSITSTLLLSDGRFDAKY